MNTLEGLPILDHCNSLLANGNEQNALAVLHEFFEFFDEESPKEHLWYMLVMALKNDTEEIEARHRSDMIFFYEYCIALFRAARVLSGTSKNPGEKRAEKRKKKPVLNR